MRRLRLLVIPILAFIVGGTMLYDAKIKAQRAAMVQPEPAEITCDDLVEHGPPDNRHVKVTDCWLADEFVWMTFSDSDEWIYALIPIYPASVQEPGAGENVALVGRINVRNEKELLDFLSRLDDEVTGCIWDDFRGAAAYGDLLREAYPRLEEGSYRVIYLNSDLPTRATARRGALIGLAVIAGGLVAAAWVVHGLFRARRRDRNQGWFADPRDEGLPDEHAAEALFGHLDRPSDVITTLRTWALLISTIALPIAAVVYAGENLEVIRPPIGAVAGGIGVVLFLAGTGVLLWTGRYFREQVYELREYRQLPRSARKYFDRQTAPLVEQGFIHLGDLRVTESMRVSVRLLVSPDRTCLVTLESFLHMTAYNLMSVADDGTLLHSVSINLERKRNTPLPSRCEWIQTDSISLALVQHQAFVAEHLTCKQEAGECLVIDPEYAIGVMDYAHRISGWSLVQRGITRKRLPPLPRAEQLTRVVDGAKTFAWQARPHNVVWSPDVLAAVRAATLQGEPPPGELQDEPGELLATGSW